MVARTWRLEAIDDEFRSEASQSGRPIVFLLWHEVLLPLLWHHRGQGIAIVVSANRDGQYLADLAEDWGYRLVRGSSSRGATRALLGAVRELQAGHPVAFTPDGPRGPRREMKPGVVAAAQRGGGIVLPIHAGVDRSWRLGSWDKFLIPKPFARIRVFYGRAFSVEDGEGGLVVGERIARERLQSLARLADGPTAP
jgi:hypothetical protein